MRSGRQVAPVSGPWRRRRAMFLRSRGRSGAGEGSAEGSVVEEGRTFPRDEAIVCGEKECNISRPSLQ